MSNEEVILEACKDAWNAGYQAAVNALRDLTSEFDDEQVKAAIREFAKTLEDIKPYET